MRRDLTEVVVVLDNSGSMALCRSNIEKGLNDFLKQQKDLPGTARFTLVNFSDYFAINTVVDGRDIRTVDSIKLEPQGNTALLDAIGRTVDSVGEKLAGTPEQDRPGLVLVAVVTDGLENNSQRFSREQIKEKIKHQQDKYGWKFLFLGANQDAIFSAKSLGLPVENALNYNTNSQGWAKGLSGNVMRARSANTFGLSYHPGYTQEEVKAATS